MKSAVAAAGERFLSPLFRWRQISAVIVLAAKRADAVGRIAPGVCHIGRDPIPGRRIVNAARAAAIGAHTYQTIVIAVTGVIRFANLSRVRMHNYQRIDHDKTATRLQRICLHAVDAKIVRGGALVVL